MSLLCPSKSVTEIEMNAQAIDGHFSIKTCIIYVSHQYYIGGWFCLPKLKNGHHNLGM